MKEYNFYNSHKLNLSTAASVFLSTRNIDPISSFGDIIGYSGVVDVEMATIIKKYVRTIPLSLRNVLSVSVLELRADTLALGRPQYREYDSLFQRSPKSVIQGGPL